MAKAATLLRQKKSAKNSWTIHKPFSSKELKDSSAVVEALLECIITGDLNSFQDVLISHLMTVNKAAVAKRAGIGRRTLYDLIDPKKEFNPELATISALLRAIAA